MRIGFIIGLFVVAIPVTAAAQDARATLRDAAGDSIGVVTLEQTPGQGVLLQVHAVLPPGVHAIHVHETGACEPPFASAGGHLNPAGRQHGFMHAGGAHAGDLPNLVPAVDGHARAELLGRDLRLDASSVFDDDGAAVVVHAERDDYQSQPSGAAGDRIACGVIRPAEPGK